MNSNYNLKHFAYIGDVVWEIFIREIVIQNTQVQKTMHQMTTKCVNAQAQADFLEKIIDKLTSDEEEIQKRGRNLKISINKKNNPKIHALATSFEVLIGYLYLSNKQRLEEIFNLLRDDVFKIIK